MSAKNTFTKETATQFDTVSMANASMVYAALKCDCQPYVDIFTYNRWLAQGYQVRRGEHGIHITTFKASTWKDDEGKEHTKRFPKGTTVFCRCQVDKINP